jgi:hypothetical protein
MPGTEHRQRLNLAEACTPAPVDGSVGHVHPRHGELTRGKLGIGGRVAGVSLGTESRRGASADPIRPRTRPCRSGRVAMTPPLAFGGGVRCASKSGQLLESTSCVVGFHDPSVGGFPSSRRPLCDR